MSTNITKIKLELEEKVLKEAVKCIDDYSCLSGNGKCLCQIDYVVEDELFFVKPERKKICNYMISFGFSYYCSCPARQEIYRLYKK